MDPTAAAVLAIAVAAGSEIIGMLPIKDNSWVQLVLRVLQTVFPSKKKEQ
jgi:hypothetical protein